jgi:hypothetical protein
MIYLKVYLLKIIFTFVSITTYAQILPTQTSNIFSGSGNCELCHKPGFPNNNALRDVNGSDISPVTLWRSTMMANAAKDPLWQAKVSAEVTAHPEFQEFIEDKCTTCHAPLGRTEAHFYGTQYYSLEEMQNDALALDGVSCTACHQIKPDNLGRHESWSGQYIIENERTIYGPFQNPFGQPMSMAVNYTPVFGEHTHKSELCATCHTLFTPTLDDNANIVGEIPEQTPYLEWKNSIYPGEGIECQTCHMPMVEESIEISNRPPNLSSRSPFAKHYFVGANVFMLKMLRDNAAEIGVTATTDQFDSTISRTLHLLQEETIELNADYKWISSDVLEIKIAVKNLSGHKFPTGYPSRRAWIKVELKNNIDSTLFVSGAWDKSTGEIINLDNPYEQHYDTIKSGNEVQIYQALMEDVHNNVTYTLLRGANYKKDNRIPPQGFSSTGPFADSIKVFGKAEDDPNFNISNNEEGSGIDTVTYVISNLNSVGNYLLKIDLLYQSVTKRFIDDLLQYDTPEVRKFENYYIQSDKSPVVIKSYETNLLVTDLIDDSKLLAPYYLFNAYPNPFNPSTTIEYQLQSNGRVKIQVFDTLGKEVAALVNDYQQKGKHSIIFDANNLSSGIYYVRMQSRNFSETKKINVMK